MKVISDGFRNSQVGGANLQGGGPSLLFGQKIPESFMKMKEIGPGGETLLLPRSANGSGRSRISQRSRQPIIWPIFPENWMKMKKYWAREEGGSCPSRPFLDPPLNGDEWSDFSSPKVIKFHTVSLFYEMSLVWVLVFIEH